MNNVPKMIRHYFTAMVMDILDDDVKTFVIGQAVDLADNQLPSALIEYVGESSDTAAYANEEIIRQILSYDVTISVVSSTAEQDQTAYDKLDDMKFSLKEDIKDDLYLMKRLPTYDPEGLRGQGLSTGIKYVSTKPLIQNESETRKIDYVISFAIEFEDSTVLDYITDDFDEYRAQIASVVDPSKIMTEAIVDLTQV